MKERTYLAIDLKSFFASVECVQRHLDPLDTNLVVADVSRTEKTICLAVSPSLKAYGLGGRARLFEVVEKVKQINRERLENTDRRKFTGKSYIDSELKSDNNLELDFISATPQMSKYMTVSTCIYGIYRKYVSEEDIVVYSIDEVFIDATDYLKMYKLSGKDFAMKLVLEVLENTGITATCGIAPNLFLCKVAMDVEAKKLKADSNGVRIAELDEMSFRKKMWEHRPLTDFWRIGSGIAKRLQDNGLYTLGDIALCSEGKPDSFYNEGLLYKLFGVNAELIIDHAWGYEPTTIKDIKSYKPRENCLSQGQVLHCPYTFAKARIIVKEMADLIALDLVKKRLVTNQVVLAIGYDISNCNEAVMTYDLDIKTDYLGRKVPLGVHSSQNIDRFTSSSKKITEAVLKIYDTLVDKDLLIRRINITVNHIKDESVNVESGQLSIFDRENEKEKLELEKEKKGQKAVVELQKKYGKNAVLKGLNFREGATTKDRNNQIGGHKA